MSTRSTIAVQHYDGTVSQVYCHFDGYLKGVGLTLLRSYTKFQKIEDLISGGSFRSLEEDLNDIKYFNDDGSDPVIFKDLDAYMSERDVQELNYLFTEYDDDKDGNRIDMWLVCHESQKDFIPLENLLPKCLRELI